MTWAQAAEFCRKLSEIAGKPCRLPTEAEWEYACRAGSRSRYWFGDSRASLIMNEWCGKNSGDEPKPVGTKKVNPWGLYDMHGNAVEWCVDWYSSYAPDFVQDPYGPQKGEFRVARGGSFLRYPNDCRSATRSRFAPDYSGITVGFRVVIADSVGTSLAPPLGPQTMHTHTNEQHGFSLVVKNPGEKPVPAFLKAFGETWLKYFVIAIVFAVGSAVWVKIRRKKKTQSPNSRTKNDKE